MTSALSFIAKADTLLVCLLPMFDVFLRFTSGVTPADLLTAEPFWIQLLFLIDPMRHFLRKYNMTSLPWCTENQSVPKCFQWIRWIQWQKIIVIKRTRTCHSRVKDQDVIRVPARHRRDRIFIFKWPQCVPQWFVRFPDFAEIAEFNESSAPFRKNSILFSFYRTGPRITSSACVRALTARGLKHPRDFTHYSYMSP